MDPRRDDLSVGGARRGRAPLALAVIAVAFLGCAGGSPGPGASATRGRTHAPAPSPEAKEASPFPSRGEIQDLAKHPVPEGTLHADYVSVARWRLAGPFPERIGEEPIHYPNTWEKLLLEAAAGRAGLVVASESMRCTAREFGRFFLEHGAYPDQSLQRMLLARCGATATGTDVGYLHGDVPAGTDDATVFQQWRDGAQELLRQYMGAGPRAVGLWFGRRNGHAVLMLASALRRVRLDPVSAIPGSDGSIHLGGEVLIPTQAIEAMINHGSYGFANCTTDPSVKLPRFALTCPTQRGDQEEWISVTARAPGRILANPVLRVLARPTGAEAATYHRPSSGRSVAITQPKDFAPRLLSELNRLRSRLHAPPLTLETQESEVADRLAPLYFGAYLGKVDPAVADVVALGLMAGWEVRGPIRRANVGGALALDTTNLAAWLGEALSQPGLRAALLSPHASRLAAGPVLSAVDAGKQKRPFLGAIVSTYALYGTEDWAARRLAFYARVDRELAARHLSTPQRDPETEGAAEVLMAQVRQGSLSPREALRQLLDDTSARLRSQAQGWTLEGTSTDDVPLPDALFSGSVHRIAAAVGYAHTPGSPWADTVVLLVDVPDVSMRAVQRAAPASSAKSASRSGGSGAQTSKVAGAGPGPSSSTSAAAWSWRRSARLAAAGSAGP